MLSKYSDYFNTYLSHDRLRWHTINNSRAIRSSDIAPYGISVAHRLVVYNDRMSVIGN